MNYESRHEAELALQDYAKEIGVDANELKFAMCQDYANVSRDEMALELVRYRALWIARDRHDERHSLSNQFIKIAPMLPELIALYREFRKVPDAGPLRAEPLRAEPPYPDATAKPVEVEISFEDLIEKLNATIAQQKGA